MSNLLGEPDGTVARDTVRPSTSNNENTGTNAGNSLYPNLPSHQPSAPGTSNVPSPNGPVNNYPGATNVNNGGYMPPSYGGGYPQLPNQNPNYPSYPPPGYPLPPGEKDPHEKGGTFNSILNFLGGAAANRGGNTGGGGGGGGGSDFSSFLNLLGGRGGSAGSGNNNNNNGGGGGGGLFSRIDTGNTGGAGTKYNAIG